MAQTETVKFGQNKLTVAHQRREGSTRLKGWYVVVKAWCVVVVVLKRRGEDFLWR
jgi:hypothetical protein